MRKRKILSLDLSTAPYSGFIHTIAELGAARQSSYVCVANVHMCVEAWQNAEFAAVVNGADVITPDGMPLVKALKLLHGVEQERVAGMDLLPALLASAAKRRLSVFFYGSTPEVLERMVSRARRENRGLEIAGHYSPPFRTLTPEEEAQIVERINESGAHLVFVALGCPKQEQWMARHKGLIHAVMLGVGGAFPVYAGTQTRAPRWMQQYSLEWLYRLCQEPRRLFKRYLVTNSLFVLLLIREFARLRLDALREKVRGRLVMLKEKVPFRR